MSSELCYIYRAVVILLIIYFTSLIKKLIFREEYPTKSIPLSLEETRREKEVSWDKMRTAFLSSEEAFAKLIEGEVRRRVKKAISSKNRKKTKIKKFRVHKKLGKPPGGKGGGRRIPAFIDRHVTLEYKSCPDCGQSFRGKKPKDSYDRYLLDLLFEKRGKRLIATHYTIQGHYCDRCEKLKYPRIDAPPKARLGWGLITWAILKRVARNMAFDAIAAEILDLCGEQISKTTLIRWLKKTAKPLLKIYAHLWEIAVNSKYIHIDETGAPLNGENWWLWVLVTKKVVIYHAHASRGHKAIKQKLTGFVGVIISDFWSAYNKLDQEQQKCLVHLVRELKEIIYDKLKQKTNLQQKREENSLNNSPTSKQQSPAPTKKKRGRPKKSSPPLTPEELRTLKNQLTQLDRVLWNCLLILFFFQDLIHLHNTAQKLKPGQEQGPPVELPSFEEAGRALESLIQAIEAEKVADDDLARILKRLRKFKAELFTFLKYEDMPHGNNPAEQKVRPFVMQRKVSGTFGSEDGLKAEAVHRSVFETCKLNQIDYVRLLNAVFHEKWEEVFVQFSNL